MNLPIYIPLVFCLSVAYTYYFLSKSGCGKKFLLLILGWIFLQGLLGYVGFYENTMTTPPRFALLVGPPLIGILTLFLTRKGRELVDHWHIAPLVWLHACRILVEFVLLWLYQQKQVPELMTFEGRNFDILAGLTAPFIAYFGYEKKVLSKPVLLAWNIICIALLANIVIHAVLAAPTIFQQIAFDQPNKGVFIFPFIWLPGFVVPAVLLSHLVGIRRLLRSQ